MPNEEFQSRTKSQTVSRVTRNASASDIPSNQGKFVRVEGDNFDIIINILIGIRRSVSSLYNLLPGQQIDPKQYTKRFCSENEWLLASSNGQRKKVNTFKFYDYAPMVF